MRFDVLTLFPEAFSAFIKTSIIGRAIAQKAIEIVLHDIRPFADNKHKSVDDVPYGGGPGMLMTPQPLWDAITHVKGLMDDNALVYFLTPQGERFTQQKAEQIAQNHTRIILLCGHYEGIDYRIREALVDGEISIGDYVLTGGEIPAQVVIETVSRLVPGVLGDDASAHEESFSGALERKKEYPQYTRPADFNGLKVPEVLLSGHHAEIEKWRKSHTR